MNFSLLDTIADIVCAHFNVDKEGLKSPSHARRYCIPKFHIVALNACLPKGKSVSGVLVGKYFNRDHSTIIYALEAWHDFYINDDDFVAAFHKFHSELISKIDFEILNIPPPRLRRDVIRKKRLDRLAYLRDEKMMRERLENLRMQKATDYKPKPISNNTITLYSHSLKIRKETRKDYAKLPPYIGFFGLDKLVS